MTLSIKECATLLKLPYIKRNEESLIKEARMNETDHETFLSDVLNYEIDERKQNAIKTKIKEAHFPHQFTLADFKRDHLSAELKRKIRELETLEFVDKGENIILIGNPGTGKTTLSIALGMACCLLNRSVLFISVPQLIIEINEAMSRSQYVRYQKRFEKYDLVILDELGYTSFSKESGEILFNLLSKRSESRSLIITSNLTMDRWNDVFKDPVLTGAIVDRLANKSHLIDMSGESYRIKQTREWMKKEENDHKISED